MNPIWTQALLNALDWMNQSPDLEPTSALRQCANDLGVEWGDPMQEFMNWAYSQLS